MKLGIAAQPEEETRTPLTASAVKKVSDMGVEVIVSAGVGWRAFESDDKYRQAGAQLVDGDQVWEQAQMVTTVQPPTVEQAQQMQAGSTLVGLLDPIHHREVIEALAQRHVTAMSLEFLPRISRAQAMDALSSQANIGGYKGVILAAERCPKMYPMMITAAGTLAPAKVVVLGVGVAGLQAIATAKRLGAVVEANDIRTATKEQVQSLGARFIDLPGVDQDQADAGGYAKELTDEQKQKQQEVLAQRMASSDAVITTAAVFGKAPPTLIPREVVERMNPGAVIVDLAASAEHERGNCEMTRPGQVHTTDGGVTIVGTLNLPRTVPVHASQVYGNNLMALVKELVKTDGEEPTFAIDLEDDVQRGLCITHQGEIVNDTVKQAYA